jgi:hypothetical protein
MFNKETMKATGKVNVALYDKKGNLKHTQTINNLVVDDGLDYIASRMKDTTETAMSHMEVGTGTTSPAAADSALETAISGSRVSLTSTTVTSNAIEYVGDFPAGTGTGAVTEAGVFNDSSAGTLLCRTVFSVVNKGADDTLKITWTVTVSDS